MDTVLFETMCREAELLLLDLDGTFYPFTEEFESHTDDVTAKTLMELGIPGDYQTLRQAGYDSYKKYGSSFTAFHHSHGLTVKDWHDAYHRLVQEAMIKEFHVTAPLLATCPVPVAVISHSNRDWISRVFKKFGLDRSIPAERIFALEDLGYQFKHESPAAYQHVLGKLGAEPKKSIVVEDSFRNLKPAKGIGMFTVGVTQGKPFDQSKYPYVDYTENTLTEFMTKFEKTKTRLGSKKVSANG